MGKIYPLQQSASWKPLPHADYSQEKAEVVDELEGVWPTATESESVSGLKTTSTNAFVVNLGRNFEGNHLTNGTPSDNNLAISNDGLIVSVDNYSIAYFKEDGDTIVQFGLPLNRLYNDPTMDRDPFDPRVIYDRYENRFILVSLFHSLDYRRSKVYLSFSKPLVADTVDWNHYQIDCDSVFNLANERWYYFDYPNISVTKSQFILSCRIARHDSATGANPTLNNVIFQIDKSDGYDSLPVISRKDWKGVENTENDKKINIVPAMDAFLGLSSDTAVYFVSNYKANSTKFFWFELHCAVNSPTATLTPHATLTNFYYSYPSFASQLGSFGGDRISVLDCDIQYALLQNNKLHFVFTRSNNGWAELVYANIDVASNSFEHSELDGSADGQNFLRPSIASYGTDSTDENFLIGFLRTGPFQLPEVCAVNLDSSGWSPAITSVKAGLGLLNWRQDLVAPWDSLERWGDYTCIQRRYNDPYRRCWMVGAYPFGLGPNHFGDVSSVNAWIAELGDSVAVGTAELESIGRFILYPNPVHATEMVTLDLPEFTKGAVQIFDATGILRHDFLFMGKTAKFTPVGLPSGMYFVKVEANGKNYETEKLVVRY